MFHLKKTEPSLRNVVSLEKSAQLIMFKNPITLTVHHRHEPSDSISLPPLRPILMLNLTAFNVNARNTKLYRSKEQRRAEIHK
jgi:hypothetical protein